MKKFLLPMLIAMMAVFASCGPDPQPICPGPHVAMQHDYFTVTPDQWQFDDNAGYLYSEWESSIITDDVINNGMVNVYYIDDYERDNQLPYLLPRYYYNDLGEIVYFWENVRYDLSNGKVTFILQPSDFDIENSYQEIRKMQFKVTAISTPNK